MNTYQRLLEFWNRITNQTLFDVRAAWLGRDKTLAHLITFSRGIAGFFLPNPASWLGPLARLGVDRASYYLVGPLRETLTSLVDFDLLNAGHPRLTVGAVNACTGTMCYFDSRDQRLSVEHVMSSGALPPAFPAVRIDGEPYWDGGFAGNPTITPLIRESSAQDTILVQINPRERLGTPRAATEILNRLNEVSFNATLMKELRMIALMRQVAEPGTGEGARWASMRTHRIMTDVMNELSYSSKLNGEWAFLVMLHDEGRRAANTFLSAHADDVGCRSTTDLDALVAEC